MSYRMEHDWSKPDKAYRPNAPKGPFKRTVSAKHPMEAHHVIPTGVVNDKYGSKYSEIKNVRFNSAENIIELVAYGELPNTTPLPYHRRTEKTHYHNRYNQYVMDKVSDKTFNGAMAEAANIKATIRGMNNTQCLDDIR